MTQVSSEGPFPESVLSLLKKARFVHLATCKDGFPHVSLMNYTYINAHDAFGASPHPIIALSTHTGTQKYENIYSNPHVSLLVHDWVTANSIYKEAIDEEEEEQEEQEEPGSHNSSRNGSISSTAPSKLLQMLQGLNQNELSSVSATLAGEATILLQPSEEKAYYKRKMLHANPDAKLYIDGDDVAIILVSLTKSRVADIQNNVSEYS
ncbi:unnamed protein product [Kuraishia capsulata CBS 1993]|uniref:Pyridoxamine 5'-phosphate oxidase N-terminal domain-containing protein n=1 Tax=Kuraishia capsulata CBS 1993 TaxID=1382522 RepID=W6MUC8_9ASCO|nr:uncharacterized protein KUCA_T00005124001 [Kuraishia capsulata CBS 1993]CDK29137.1 unnamed protein product [Kuraishia capsulata CBS 1993]